MKVSEVDLTAVNFAKRRRLASQISRTWIGALEYPGLILFLNRDGFVRGGRGTVWLHRQTALEAGQFRVDQERRREEILAAVDTAMEEINQSHELKVVSLVDFLLAVEQHTPKGQRPC